MFIHTKYSINYGMKSPEEIIDWAINAELPFLVVADINSTTALISSLKYAQEKKVNVIIGVDIRNTIQPCYHIIAENNRGFHEINEFLTPFLHSGEAFPDRAPYFANCKVVYPLSNKQSDLLSHELIGIQPHEVNKIAFLRGIPKEKLLAFPVMTFQTKREYNSHRLLRAIHLNILLSQLKEEEQAPQTEVFRTFSQLKSAYETAPFLLDRLQTILASCHIHFSFGDQVEPKNLSTYTGSVKEDRALVESICEKGKAIRFPHVNFEVPSPESLKVTQRINHEINTIEQKGYLSYFLITWDIIHFAKSKGYFHVGRGSGANSVVAYLLGITDVDPLDLDLYFERFINLHRKNPPDFDIDFSWTERDDVLQYIFRRFPNTALICTYNTYQYRSCIRELGKVLGVPKGEIDKLTRMKGISEELDEVSRLVLKYSQYIAGLPSHLSIHAGGVIISEKPITWYSPTFLPPKGFPTVQFAMFEAEDIGFYKFDILSQRGLGKIKDCLNVIAYNQPNAEVHDIHDIEHFKKDLKIQNLLQTGEAMGCFYVESPAMRMLMKKLKTKTYLDLVAASSIIRPGVASSGMMHEYILRHKVPEKRKEANPLLLELMPETYGIMVYQEDVIKVAHHFAGLSLDEADILRRGMSGKYRSLNGLTSVEAKFFDNCREKGHDETLIQSIWHQIKSFAGYAFSKGHSASYAVESFQSLYLKAYFPLEYMVATINNFGGYYETEFYINEARRLGATIEAPCIINSHWQTIIKGKTIYLGFQHVLGLDYKETKRILDYRNENKGISSFQEVLKKLYPTLENLLSLIKVEAFRNVDANKLNLKWEAHLFYKKASKTKQQHALFEIESKEYELPEFEETITELANEELELLGFSLRNPFSLLQQPILEDKLIPIHDLHKYEKQFVTLYGYLVSVKYVRTKNGKRMNFGTFQDYWGEIFDTVHFPQSIQQFPFYGRGVYQLFGKVVNDFDYYSLEVIRMEILI